MSESSNKLECLVLDKLSELQKKVCRLFGFTINPEIAFDLKGQAAGQANYLKNKIRFNRDLLEKFTDEFVSQTVPMNMPIWLRMPNSVDELNLMEQSGNQ